MPAKLAKHESPASPNLAPAQRSASAATELLAWYDRHARRLPWRVGPKERKLGTRPDPYRVWLSEIMLQQTTVKAAAPYFQRFLARWPQVGALAAADEREVMAAWAGLGYYARARNLIACAKSVAARLDARFPDTAEELTRLPGIGGYTSAAIAAIAFGQPVAVIDGNVDRVIARVFAIDTPLPAAKLLIAAALTPLVPDDRPGEFAEALMDLGATLCTPKKPACGLCPWSERCVARREGRQLELPVKAAKKPRPRRHGAAYVVRRADGAILLRRRPPSGLLGGMSEVPGTDWSEAAPPRGSAPLAATWMSLAASVEHTFTHFSLRLVIERAEVAADTPAPAGHWWAGAETLPGEALPSVMKKAIEAAYPGATKQKPRVS
jgi:A/G-specific adenine glycosylase